VTYGPPISTTAEHHRGPALLGNSAHPGHAQDAQRHAPHRAVTTTIKNRYFSLNPEVRITDRMYFDQLRKTVRPAMLDTVYTVTLPIGFAHRSTGAWGPPHHQALRHVHLPGQGLRAIRHVITPTAGFNYQPRHRQHPDRRTLRCERGTIATYSPFDIGIYGKPTPSSESGHREPRPDPKPGGQGARRQGHARTGRDDPTKKIKLFDFVGVNTNYDLLKDSLNWSPVNSQRAHHPLQQD
jgi:hypothetical protein